jgi:hypothetical protein
MIFTSSYRGVTDYASNGRRISVAFAEYPLGERDLNLPCGAVYPHGNTRLSAQEVSFLQMELGRLHLVARTVHELKPSDRLFVVHSDGKAFVPTGENIDAAC